MPVSQFTILPPLEFITDFADESRSANRRMYLQSMEVEPGTITNNLLEILAVGARKQLDARLHIDYYSLLIFDGIFNYLPLFSKEKEQQRESRIKKRNEYFTMLKKEGVTITYTNPPTFFERIFPVMGRNHIKIAVVDDKAWIGGINFHDGNFNSIDSMVKLTDPALVDPIARLFLDTEDRKKFSDRKISVSDNTSLLIDGGKIGQSIILNEAVRLIQNAQESVKIISPIIPDTKLAEAVHVAGKNGKKVEIVVPHLSKMTGIFKFLDLFNSLLLRIRPLQIPIYYKNIDIHAKMLLVDNKHVLMGSHNLTSRGVAVGTEELAISSSDPHLAHHAASFFKDVNSL